MFNALAQRIRATSNAGTAVNLDSDQVMAGVVNYITFAAVANGSGEAVKVQFQLVTGDEAIQIAPAVAALADGDATNILPCIVLFEGQKLRAVITGTANHALVSLVICGEWWEWPPAQEAVTPERAAEAQGY